MEAESRPVGARGWETGVGSDSFGGDENILELDRGGDGLSL